MSAAFPNGSMDMGMSGMPTAQQALQLMGRHDFLSASAGLHRSLALSAGGSLHCSTIMRAPIRCDVPGATPCTMVLFRVPDGVCCAGIAGLTPESAAALQALGAAAAASRLGLDSSVASHAAFSGKLSCFASLQQCCDGSGFGMDLDGMKCLGDNQNGMMKFSLQRCKVAGMQWSLLTRTALL